MIRSPTLRAAYEHETATLVAQRLAVFALIFFVFMGLGTIVEVVSFPERRPWSWLAALAEMTVCLGGALGARRPSGGATSRRIGGWTGAAVVVLVVAYHAFVGASAYRVLMVLGLVVGSLAVTVPWGAWPQAVVGGVGVLAIAAGTGFGWLPADQEAPAMPAVAMFATACITAFSAYTIDRSRFETFLRAMLQAEEAEITANLLSVTQTLSEHLDRPGALDEVTALAARALGTDHASIFLVDPDRELFTLAANTGAAPEFVEALKCLEFHRDSLPISHVLRPGELVEIPDARTQALIPPELMERMSVRAALFAAISRHGRIIGALTAGYRSNATAFSPKQRRLALGIAHATAVALENTRLVRELQAANRLKSEFVATMSHELRTPLNVIAGYTDMLADRVFEPDSPGWTDAITRVRRATVELTDLVAATLDLNRLDAGRDPVDRRPVDLGALLARIDSDTEPLTHASVALRWHVTVADVQIVTDATKLYTILKNLVVNALKFTTVGTVDVEIGTDEDALVLRVRDTGIGIAPEHLATIFEMFRQLDASSTRRFGGVGLGLHIVQRLTTLLGGTITVESTVGVGSAFTIRVPGAIRALAAAAV